MTTTKNGVAEALTPMLSAFHSIGDASLQGVWQFYSDGSLDKVVLDFGAVSLIIVADENDDSIDFTVTNRCDVRGAGTVDGRHREPWSGLIGKPFGWGWIIVNQQGYCDGLLLSFAGIVPQLLLNVIASSIKVSAISTSA